MTVTETVDVFVHNHGSIFVLEPLTPTADDWFKDNLPDDATSWGKGVVVEPRYVEDVVQGMTGDGLVVR
jgi:hypothetical protein